MNVGANKTRHDAHNEHVREMLGEHSRTGKMVDPVTRVEFPKGVSLVVNPNREQRRALAQWRRKVSR